MKYQLFDPRIGFLYGVRFDDGALGRMALRRYDLEQVVTADEER